MAIKQEEKEYILVERQKYEAMESRDKGVFESFFTIQIIDDTKDAHSYTRYMTQRCQFWARGSEVKLLDKEDVIKNIEDGINDGIYIANRKVKLFERELNEIKKKWWYKLFNKL